MSKDKQIAEMTEDICEKCKIKKHYAKMDFHWHDHEDCPFVCPFAEAKLKEREGK